MSIPIHRFKTYEFYRIHRSIHLLWFPTILLMFFSFWCAGFDHVWLNMLLSNLWFGVIVKGLFLNFEFLIVCF